MDRLDEHVRWIVAAPIYIAAYALAAAVFWRVARRRGFAAESAAAVMAAGLLGGLLGAIVAQALAAGTPGKTIEGGIAGGWLAVIAAKRFFGIARPTGDLFALAIPAGEAIGRIGCFLGGCCYGRVTSLAWAVHDHGALRHPAQLYLSLAAVAAFALLAWVERKRVLPENGLFYLGGMLFCIARFGIEFVRDNAVVVAGLDVAQLACVAGFAFFAWKFGTLLAPVTRGIPAA